LTNKTKTY
jgi:aldehyde dehydrogenase (NAD+)